MQFLRHVERTSVLLHLIDISDEASPGAWHDFETINRELELFNPDMLKKRQVVAIGKLDLTTTRERVKKEIDTFARKGIKIFAFSAATGEGVPEVLRELITLIPPHLAPAAEESGVSPEELPS
jgi:GTPase